MRTIASLLAISLATGTATPVHADDLVRGLIGIGGTILLNEAMRSERRREEMRQREIERSSQRQRERAAVRTRDSQARARDEERRLARVEIQRRLNALGFEAGKPDGDFGPKTRAAIARFQASIAAEPDGKISPTQIEQLYAATGGADGNPDGIVSLNDVPSAGGVAPAFPTLGGGATATSPGVVFPRLGGSGEQTADGVIPAFPVLGQSTAPASQPGAFPSLGATPAADGQVMPQLGTPAPAAPAASPSFPQVAAAPASAGMPPLAAAPLQASVGAHDEGDTIDPAVMSLDIQVSETPYKSAGALPAILGLKLGMSDQFVQEQLGKDGYGECSDEAFSIRCSRSTATLTDSIRVGRTASGTIWLLDRTVTFREPVEAMFLTEQMNSAYPEIMAMPNQRLGSANGCLEQGGITDASVDTVDRLAEAFETAADLEADLAGVAAVCPVGFAVQFGTVGNMASEFRIRFHDATPLLKAAAEARIEQTQARRENIAKDLKF